MSKQLIYLSEVVELSRMVMYTGGLGPYCVVNGKTFPEKIVVEIEDKDMPAFHRRRKFVEVKGVQLMKKPEQPEYEYIRLALSEKK